MKEVLEIYLIRAVTEFLAGDRYLLLIMNKAFSFPFAYPLP